MSKNKASLFVGAIILTLGVFVGTEGAVFSMVASGINRINRSADQTLFNRNRVHDLQNGSQFSVLAAGDIAACDDGRSVRRFTRNLRYSLGLARPAPDPNEGMLATSHILEQNPDITVLALGDLAYQRGAPVAFQDCYDPYWGKAKARTWPTPGNHGYRSLGAFGYFDYWGERAGPDRAGYYALRAENWILLSLNSETDASEGSAQARWIDSILAGNKEKCIGAFYHKPAFSAVERRDSRNAKLLFSKLAKAGTVFVLNGHNHFFERTVPLDFEGNPAAKGTTIFVSGAGGKVTNGNILGNNRTAKLVTETPGLLKLDFTKRSINWTYLTKTSADPPSKGQLTCS